MLSRTSGLCSLLMSSVSVVNTRSMKALNSPLCISATLTRLKSGRAVGSTSKNLHVALYTMQWRPEITVAWITYRIVSDKDNIHFYF